MKKSTIWIIISAIMLPVILISCLALGFFAFMYYSFNKAINPITDINDYSELISSFKESCPHCVAHFPNEIPTEAKNVEFYYCPAFLQGDSELNLKFQTSPETINAYYDQFKKDATKTENIEYFQEMDGKFERLYFQKDIDNTPEHTPSYGIIIDKEQCIIVFWAHAIY